ncbi:MAG: type II toxin-antitoxin system Phd/YefM family antitoxin [Gemmatimonadota bacterium]|nr:type II toxin-antitoxin system Phd/YefM family antitoxin [Gemmatimonadota bacterium]
MHRTQDTYSLSDFRQRTSEHLDRIREGRVETITQNGEAAMVVMSPERYDFLVHSAERGHIWREAIRAHRAGGLGIPVKDAIRDLAEELGVEPLERGIPERGA